MNLVSQFISLLFNCCLLSRCQFFWPWYLILFILSLFLKCKVKPNINTYVVWCMFYWIPVQLFKGYAVGAKPEGPWFGPYWGRVCNLLGSLVLKQNSCSTLPSFSVCLTWFNIHDLNNILLCGSIIFRVSKVS